MAVNDENATTLKADSHKDGGDLPPQRFDQTQPNDTESTEPRLTSEEELLAVKAELDKTKQALVQLNDKAQKNWDMLLRKEADMQNMQKRFENQLENAKKFALERFAAELLQVVDSIEQGLTHCNVENVTVKDVLDGMILTRKVVLGVMEKEGILQIDPQSQAFDPNFHEAIAMVDSTQHPANHVVEVVQKGYMLKERLLRPARVVVSRAPAPEQKNS